MRSKQTADSAAYTPAHPISVHDANLDTTSFSNEETTWPPLRYPYLSGGKTRNFLEIWQGSRKAAGWRTAQGSNYGGYMYSSRYHGLQGHFEGFQSSLAQTRRQGRRMSGGLLMCPLILHRDAQYLRAPMRSVAIGRLCLVCGLKLRHGPDAALTYCPRRNHEARGIRELAARRHHKWFILQCCGRCLVKTAAA